MESTERALQRSSSFNPQASAFNPKAAAFDPNMQEPNQSEPNASAGVGGSGYARDQQAYVNMFNPGVPGQRVAAIEPAFESSPFPRFPATPPRHLMMSSNVYPRRASELEHHAMNLGLPIGPFQNETVATVSQQNQGRRLSTDQYGTQGVVPSGHFGTPRSVAQEVQPSDYLFPVETRTRGLDGKLIQEALTRSLTAEDVQKHLAGTHLRDSGNVIAPSANPSASRVPVETVIARHTQSGVNPDALLTSFDPTTARYSQAQTGISGIHHVVDPAQQQFHLPTVPRAMAESTIPRGASLDQTLAQPNRTPNRARTSSTEQSHGSSGVANRARCSFTRGKFAPKPKRMDQGPEPSNADIYPEDAVADKWAYHAEGPVEGYSVNKSGTKPHLPPQPEAKLETQNTTAWLTPTETVTFKKGKDVIKMNDEEFVFPVLKPLPALGTIRFMGHDVPADSINAGASSTSTPFTGAMQKVDPYDYRCDERPLSPSQADGSRYGLKLQGIGHCGNDSWNPPAVKYCGQKVSAVKRDDSWGAVPFRVRPVNRQGWGGWEWAHLNGWFDDEH